MNDYIELLNPEHKKMTKEQIKARMQELYRSGRWSDLKREIIQYNIRRDEVIKEMENHTDPVFRRFLDMYKETMTKKEYEHNRLRIYAICNRHAMYHRVPVDVLVTGKHPGLF